MTVSTLLECTECKKISSYPQKLRETFDWNWPERGLRLILGLGLDLIDLVLCLVSELGQRSRYKEQYFLRELA